MAAAGHRHMLVMYKTMLAGWWKAVLWIGIATLLLTGILAALPEFLPEVQFTIVDRGMLWFAGGMGAFTILLGILVAVISRTAFVQPFPDHIQVGTPFLRVNISYRRMRQTNSIEMQGLFPANTVSKRARGMLRPLASETAVVIELTAFPVSRRLLRIFLCRYFFPDTTPRLALLVPDWISFSTEMESFRSAWRSAYHKTPTVPGSIFQRQ